MQSPSLTHVLAGALCLGSIVAALLRAKHVERPTLRLVPANIWVLEQFCQTVGAMLGDGPVPQRVAIDLSNIAYLDDSSLSALDYACARWSQAGVHVTLEGCNRGVAKAIRRHRVRATM
jgi:hypothetical protein